MNYDDWKTTEPDPNAYARGVRCLNYPGCDNFVTFPEFEVECSSCQIENRRRAASERQRRRQFRLAENQVPRG